MDSPRKTPDAEARLGATFDAALRERVRVRLDAEFDVTFETTPEEQRHRAVLRRLLDEEGWKKVASEAAQSIRESYRRGEVTQWDAVRWMGRLSCACWPADRVRLVGRTDAVKERFYAISAERRIKNPAVAAITERARERLSGAR